MTDWVAICLRLPDMQTGMLQRFTLQMPDHCCQARPSWVCQAGMAQLQQQQELMVRAVSGRMHGSGVSHNPPWPCTPTEHAAKACARHEVFPKSVIREALAESGRASTVRC